ncbi:MAG: hypothetical protein CMM50_00650 [Rhodospirillaceae bacterium]|nr:hypothetical protein [Rhodospirillaceae bacterium]
MARRPDICTQRSRLRRISMLPAIGASVAALALLAWPAARGEAEDVDRAAAEAARTAVAEGNALFAEGDYLEAERRYLAADELLPETPEIRYDLGNAVFSHYDFSAAVEHYTHALQTQDLALEARAHYNLATALYQQALNSMQTMGDAVTPIKAAIGHLRDSLAIAPDQPDARYNLELAHKMLTELEKQRVEKQDNAGVRDQKSSPNEGQAFDEEMDGKKTTPPDDDPEAENQDEGGEGQAGGDSSPTAQSGAQSSEASMPQAMTPEAAEEMIELIRDRNQAAQDQRLEWRRSRIRNAAVEKEW